MRAAGTIAGNAILLALLSAAVLTACTRQHAEKLSFNETIQPILSENCYGCHGPDKSSRKAGLRLDRAEFAYAAHEDFGPAIVPGKPDKSPLIRRIEASDEKERMPPPEAHKRLKPEQIALLRRWVQEGAEYQEHWAFIAPVRPAVPVFAATDANADWPRNDIDRFILTRLNKERLQPAPEEERYALIRRVTYDLIGLPPAPAEVQEFINDTSRDAYEKVVNRLLESPRYGEHRAHYWLDVARYGDTRNVLADHYSSIWPYRDYVIRSYNENKAFDQFVREQLAGDLLPAQNLDQLVASAFMRVGNTSNEEAVEELRVNNKRERAETFGAAFMGLTTGCAACHDHKFDPISQKDFYQLTAFFNNLTENPSDENLGDWPPLVRLPKPQQRIAYEEVMRRRAVIQGRINELRAQAPSLIARWLAQTEGRPQPVSAEGLMVRLRFDEGHGATMRNSAPHAKPESITATGSEPQWGEEVLSWPSMRMDTSTRIELPAMGDFDLRDAFSVSSWVMPRQAPSMMASGARRGSIIARMDANLQRGWELVYDEGEPERIKARTAKASMPTHKGRLVFNLMHAGADNSISVETNDIVLVRGRWDHVLAIYDGSGRASGVKLYVNGEAVPMHVLHDHLVGTIRTRAPLNLGRRYPDADALRQTRYQDFRLYSRALSEEEASRVAHEDYVAELVQRPQKQWNEQEFKTIADFYFAKHSAPMQSLVNELPALNAELARLSEGGDTSLVSEESSGLAYADVLTRGTYNQRTEKVRPGVPHFLPPLPAGATLDRRGLAQWVVDVKNPLTARVTVNRMWQEVFGTGIVETTEDFGTVGARPSHPELLDWLAIDFMTHGWNVKRFYKQLVMSATYRQTARITPELLERDPKNRLLARGPRFRMDAEMVRDTVLAASGLLVERIGGPSVKPYQPAGVWEAVSIPGTNTAHYEQDHGASLFRRSLYTFWKRKAPAPSMDTFDSPARDAACTRRQRTNTPLQALVTMNDPQWLEAARKLAERALHQEKDVEGRLDFMARILLSRPLEPAERAAFLRVLGQFRAAYEADEAAAARLIAIGESPLDGTIDAKELAPWMLVASAAMNLDEVLNK